MNSTKLLTAIAVVTMTFACFSCQRKQMHVVSSQEQAIAIDASLDAIADSDYIEHLQSYKQLLESELNVVLGHAPEALRAYKPESEMSNWASDALREMAVLKTGKPVDLAVVNIGGLRCEWEAGDVTMKNVFELMPFDNELVILSLSGKDLLDLAQCVADTMGQGISGMRLEIHNHMARNVTLNGRKIAPQMIYRVATSDYLSEGNDHLEPLANYTAIERTDLKIRDLYIEHIRLHPTVAAKIDGRCKVK